MANIHARMPAILEQADWPVWLGEAEGDPVALLRAPAADDVLKALAGQPSGKHAA